MSLFGNKQENPSVEASNERNIIGKGTSITGDIETFGNIRIDGKLVGNIHSKSKVALGQGSMVEGNIYAQNAEIEGEIVGRIEITDVLILHPTAVINGDIFTEKLVVKSGAKFNGACQMGQQNAKKAINGTNHKEVKIENHQSKEKAKAAV